MIKDSIKKERKYFSFGRSSQNSSLLNFKRQWKPIERKLYFSYSHEKNRTKTNEIFNKNLEVASA